MTATAAATGARVWLAAKAPAWFTGAVKGWLSGAIMVGGVLAAGILAEPGRRVPQCPSGFRPIAPIGAHVGPPDRGRQ